MRREAESFSVESEPPTHRLTVAFVGEDRHTGARRDVLRRAGHVVVELEAEATATEWDARIDDCAAVIVAAPSSGVGRIAGGLVKRGLNVLLESMPVSIEESQGLDRLAAEAGTQMAVGRPIRFHPEIVEYRQSGRCSLLTVDALVPDSSYAWKSDLENIVDLCGLLCGTFNARNIDASATRRGGRFPVFVGFSMRFENGAFAQVSVRSSGEVAVPYLRVVCGRRGDGTDIEVGYVDEAVRDETSAFVETEPAGDAGVCSLWDGVRTARLVGRILDRLR